MCRVAAAKPVKTAKSETLLRHALFPQYTDAEFEEYKRLTGRLAACPGHKLLKEVLRDAGRLRAKVRTLLADYGPDSDSTLRQFIDLDDEPAEVWDELRCIAVVLASAPAFVDCSIPHVG